MQVLAELTSANLPLEHLSIRARGLMFPALACGTGPLVLCLHGFPDTSFTFRHLLPALAAAGYRAVAPALRGYDPACMPPSLGDAHAVEVARDALAIVEALGESRAHLIGHDWGAVASYLAAALAPEPWSSVTTLAIPHPLGIVENLHRLPRQARHSWYMLFFQLPAIAERAVAARDFALIEQLWRTWSPSYRAEPAELAQLKQAFRQPGVVPASLAYYRNMFALTGKPARTAMALLKGVIQPPVLAISGSEDGCIDTRMFGLAMGPERFSSVVVEQLLGLGHFMHLEDPARIAARIVSWLQVHP
ncbi:MAG: alpha/beta hydrolase [Myxococcales bacterium]